VIRVERPADLPEEATADNAYYQNTGLKSNVTIPLSVGGSMICAIAFGSLRAYRSWPDDLVEQLKQVAEIFAHAIYRKRAEQKLETQFQELKKSYREINELKDRLQAESDYLRAEVKVAYRHGPIIGESAAIKKVLGQLEQVAATEAIVLIQGETGTGKELIAEAIHNYSRRKERVMVKVNCATLPPPLIESELFGRERGAYTGALTKQAGRFEIADGSTILLDEIGEMPLELQVKLLRVLQNGEFERLGSPKTVKVDVRVIAATNRDLAEEMRKGNFREDLYYRLNVFPILMPPLRERVEDIPPLVWAFVNEFGKKMGKKIQKIPKTTMETLQRHSWPGNIRELRNVIENAMILSAGSTLQVQAFDRSDSIKPAALTLEETERRHIFAVLEKTNWRIKGANGAAEMLGLKSGTLYAKMHKLGIPHARQKSLNIDQKSK
jgi:transcriptional regulator with GAF, ATPase, and Fis domain